MRERQRAKRIADSKEASVIDDSNRMLMHSARTTTGKEDARMSNNAVLVQDQRMPRRRAVCSIGEVVLEGVGADVIGRTRRVRRFVDEIQVVVPGFEEHCCSITLGLASISKLYQTVSVGTNPNSSRELRSV